MALEVYSVPLSLRWLPGARADGRCCPVRERPCVPTAMCRPPGPGIRACSCRSRAGCDSAPPPSAGRRGSLDSSACWPPEASRSAFACLSPACARRGAAPSAAPHGRSAGRASCLPHGPRAAAAHAAADSRSAVAPGPRPSGVRATLRHPTAWRDNAHWFGRCCPPGTPAAGSSRRSTADIPQPPDARRASPFFSQEILQRNVVQHCVRQHPLKLGVLILQRLQPPSFGHVQPAELGFPLVECRRTQPVLAAQVHHRDTRLLLPQNPNDLLFREP